MKNFDCNCQKWDTLFLKKELVSIPNPPPSNLKFYPVSDITKDISPGVSLNMGCGCDEKKIFSLFHHIDGFYLPSKFKDDHLISPPSFFLYFSSTYLLTYQKLTGHENNIENNTKNVTFSMVEVAI